MSLDWKPKALPWEAADYSPELVYAVRAFVEGKALPHQQTLVWQWIGYITGSGDGYQDLSFRPGPDGQRATDFAEGKRWVGLHLKKMLHPAVTPPAVGPEGKRQK